MNKWKMKKMFSNERGYIAEWLQIISILLIIAFLGIFLYQSITSEDINDGDEEKVTEVTVENGEDMIDSKDKEDLSEESEVVVKEDEENELNDWWIVIFVLMCCVMSLGSGRR